jgi:hypothetical protein
MEKKPTGRPTMYNEELASALCARIAEGESLRNVCKDDGMPAISAVLRWLTEDDKQFFKDQYDQAKLAQAEHLFHEILEITDQEGKDFYDADGKKIPNSVKIQRDRLRIDTRKWYLSKVLPKVYGEKLDLSSGGEKLSPNIVNVNYLTPRENDDNDQANT